MSTVLTSFHPSNSSHDPSPFLLGSMTFYSVIVYMCVCVYIQKFVRSFHVVSIYICSGITAWDWIIYWGSSLEKTEPPSPSTHSSPIAFHLGIGLVEVPL